MIVQVFPLGVKRRLRRIYGNLRGFDAFETVIICEGAKKIVKMTTLKFPMIYHWESWDILGNKFNLSMLSIKYTWKRLRIFWLCLPLENQ